MSRKEYKNCNYYLRRAIAKICTRALLSYIHDEVIPVIRQKMASTIYAKVLISVYETLDEHYYLSIPGMIFNAPLFVSLFYMCIIHYINSVMTAITVCVLGLFLLEKIPLIEKILKRLNFEERCVLAPFYIPAALCEVYFLNRMLPDTNPLVIILLICNTFPLMLMLVCLFMTPICTWPRRELPRALDEVPRLIYVVFLIISVLIPVVAFEMWNEYTIDYITDNI